MVPENRRPPIKPRDPRVAANQAAMELKITAVRKAIAARVGVIRRKIATVQTARATARAQRRALRKDSTQPPFWPW